MDKGHKERKIIVPIICFFLAFGLWFYVENLENPIRERDLSKVPVEIHNAEYLSDYKLTLAPNQEYYATLRLSGPSTDLYKVKASDFKLSVDLSEYGLAKGIKKIPIKIEQSPNNISIKNTNTLTIDLSLELLVEKEIEIKSNLIVKSAEGYTSTVSKVEPSKVVISGPESEVNKVTSAVIEGELHSLKEDKNETFEVKAVDASGREVTGVELSVKEVNVQIKVNKGKSVPVKINYKGNLKDGGKLKALELSNKTVELIGTKEALDKISEVSTEMIDLSQYNIGDTITASIVITNDVMISPGEEQVTIKVTGYKITSKELEIKVNLLGIEEGVSIDMPKKTVKVKVTAYEDEINSVTEDKIKAEINLQGVSEGHHEATPIIKTVGIGENIKVEAIESISYTLTKQQDTNQNQ